MPRNLEIKARYENLSQVKKIAEKIGARHITVLHQIDTYFVVPKGRLKLREIEGEPAELIYYEREESANHRNSDFQIYKCDDSAILKDLLTNCFGARASVEKKRTLYIYNDTRVHLDEVVGLGTFIEFEVPVKDSPEDAEKTLEFLLVSFGIKNPDFIKCSYIDMMLESLPCPQIKNPL